MKHQKIRQWTLSEMGSCWKSGDQFSKFCRGPEKSANVFISQFPAWTFFFFPPCAFCSQLRLDLHLPLFTFELDCWNHSNHANILFQNRTLKATELIFLYFCKFVILYFYYFLLLFCYFCIVHPPVSTEICNDPIFCPNCLHSHSLRHLKQRFTKWVVRAIS